MNFLADESIDRQIVDDLRTHGHAVDSIAEMEPGISDEVVLALANRRGSMLLTADKDFGELVFRTRRISAGVLLIRLLGLSPASKAKNVSSLVNGHSEELPGSFSVITPAGIRIRRKIP